MIQVELSHDQIMALLDAIDVCVGEGQGHVPAIYEAKLTLENASNFEDHIIFPDGHRLQDSRD